MSLRADYVGSKELSDRRKRAAERELQRQVDDLVLTAKRRGLVSPDWKPK